MIDYKINSDAKTLHLNFPGDIISTNVDDLNDDVLNLLESDSVKSAEWSKLHLDLTHARMIDSFGFDFLVKLFKKMSELSISVKVTVASPLIRRNFSLLQLDKSMEVELIKRKSTNQ